ETCLGELEISLSRANFTTWFKNTSILSYENGVIVISVPNAFTKEWLSNKYHRQLFLVLSKLLPVSEIKYQIGGVPTELKEKTEIKLEVEEEKLEAYAILTTMGPTYLWFQLYKLQDIVKSFGLSETEIEEGILKMIYGSIQTMYKSGLPPSSVMDLVPVKPLGEEEGNIKIIYERCLNNLFKKLKG
ncbi:MAG: hypothetical protein NC929_00935, partial [Candidatus Omnitrophica bacterium]|nr:hypothetical protein [Candidatus Omnitrophota bacterium]